MGHWDETRKTQGFLCHCFGRVGRAGRTAANVCSRWVRGRLRHPETLPSWPETSAHAVRRNAGRVKVLDKRIDK